ncbi:ABC transporter ATP-binding protein [Actinoplanes sp. N902-109]|uniref:ABC transporter ATP-binding protein n=1 Tax=Actinoplanes sp. (strain N902-109) TaxID=649831 RepID=UPI00032958AD|nr:ATP-binding cassette domain-containing protein [Actinoplanes sp. N902-109]AGL13758.1 ABC transporter, ATP-binding protein [Actinoplanes sp. N902-109]
MLQLDKVVRRFGERTVVDEVSFQVADGLITGFVGGNGAGKTTTMRMIMGVLAITDGEIRWNGRTPTRDDRRTFGYMPEERGLYPKQSVLSQLLYLGRLRGLGAAGAKRATEELLERFGLADKRDAKLESLSLGNQQRVQIVAALMGDPALLVLDEPFSGLDPLAVDSMADVLREITGRGVPVLFSSHQLDLVERLCDHLVVLSAGRVVGDGTPDQLRRKGQIRHRLRTAAGTRWVRDIAGVTVVTEENDTVLVELASAEAADGLLTEALRRGSVREFAEVVPSVGDVFRELAA